MLHDVVVGYRNGTTHTHTQTHHNTFGYAHARPGSSPSREAAMAPTPTKVVPDAAEETAVAAGVMSSALEAALGSAPEEEEAEHQEETEESPIASPPPPPLHGASACLHHHHSHHGRRPPRRGPDHYHRHAHPPDRPPRGVAEVFDRLVAGVIRPPRMIYEARALGPNPLLVPEQGLVAVRTDFEVTNARGQRLQCSVWKALDPNVSLPSNSTSDGGGGWPCVVYLHGNSSSRVEAVKTQVLKAALAGGAGGVAAFDFSGCGLSEGEFLSLGFFEAQDCAAVVDELRRRFGVGPAVLWGRSMGAVSALVYAATGGSLATRQQQRRGRRRGRARQAHGAGGVRPADPPPAGLILDSPFSSFRRLALDLTTKGLIRMPRLAVAAVLALLRRSVKRRAGFDLYHVNPLAHAHRAAGVGGIPIPALFLAAEQDELISPWHGEALEAAWPGPHKLGIRFPGTHNSTRPPIAYALASIFVRGAAVCAREYPALAATMALRLVERTAVVASQEEAAAAGAAAGVGAQGNGEEDEEGAGDGGGESESRRERRRQRREERRRRRERERRQQSPFQYGEAGAEEEGGEGKRKTKTQKPPPAPRFVRAGDGGRGSLASLPGATRALVAALDSSLAARAVEEYLLEELLYVGVALVAADLREGARAEQVQAQAGKEEAVAGTSQKVGSFVVLFGCVAVDGSGQVCG